MEWLPIDTAPKDEPVLLLSDASYFDYKGEEWVPLTYVWAGRRAGTKRKPVWVSIDDDGLKVEDRPLAWAPWPAAPKPGGERNSPFVQEILAALQAAADHQNTEMKAWAVQTYQRAKRKAPATGSKKREIAGA